MSPDRRSLLGAAATAAVLVSCAPALAAPASTASLVTKGSTDLGRVNQPRSVVLVLAGSHPAALRAFLAQRHHARLSSKTFTSLYGPSRSSTAAVTRWARGNRLSVQSVSVNRVLVQIRATTGALGRALGVSFHLFAT